MTAIKDTFVTITIREEEGANAEYHVSRTGNIEVVAKPGADINSVVNMINVIDDGFVKTKIDIKKKREATANKLIKAINRWCLEYALPAVNFTYKADEAEYANMSIDFDDANLTINVISSLVFMIVPDTYIEMMAKYLAFDCLESLVEFGKTDTRRYNAFVDRELASNLNELYAPLDEAYGKISDEEKNSIKKEHAEAEEFIKNMTKELGVIHVIQC